MIYNYDPHQKIQEKAHVVIEDSSELRAMHLDEFIGMEGMVGGEYDKEEWFFPILALRDVNAKSIEEEFGDFVI